jgi:hypothetical protein
VYGIILWGGGKTKESIKALHIQKKVGVRMYKHLPLKIKKLYNFNQFRKEVKSMLLNNSFYILEEFLQAKLV